MGLSKTTTNIPSVQHLSLEQDTIDLTIWAVGCEQEIIFSMSQFFFGILFCFVFGCCVLFCFSTMYISIHWSNLDVILIKEKLNYLPLKGHFLVLFDVK